MQDRRTATIPSNIPGQPPYRLNVGLIMFNRAGQVLVARKYNQNDEWANKWQLPQGGVEIAQGKLFEWRESAGHALYREIKEELGLPRRAVKVVAKAKKPVSWAFNDDRVKKYSGKLVHWYAAVAGANFDPVSTYAAHKTSLLWSGKKPEFAEVKWMNIEDLVDNSEGTPWHQAYNEVNNEFKIVRTQIMSGRNFNSPQLLYRGWLPARWFLPRLSR